MSVIVYGLLLHVISVSSHSLYYICVLRVVCTSIHACMHVPFLYIKNWRNSNLLIKLASCWQSLSQYCDCVYLFTCVIFMIYTSVQCLFTVFLCILCGLKCQSSIKAGCVCGCACMHAWAHAHIYMLVFIFSQSVCCLVWCASLYCTSLPRMVLCLKVKTSSVRTFQGTSILVIRVSSSFFLF